ncbi:MAG TPA: PAS domain S-box protein [Candidatus Thermoplasmatota archaeon]|nr:PAS domain S-box protein [Candidatus Thermoplasmatota archaeon]
MAALTDGEIIAALAAASRTQDPYLANVLATEALNRTRRMSAITGNLGEGVLATDCGGRITWVNPAVVEMVGGDAETLLGDSLWAWLEGPGGPFPGRGAEALPPGAILQHGDLHLRQVDGGYVPVAATFTAILPEAVAGVEGRPESEGMVVILRDVTAEKREATARQERNARLREQNAALVSLAKRIGAPESELPPVLDHILLTSARTVRVARASVWCFNEGRDAIECLRLYDETRGFVEGGLRISAAENPAYFAALEEARALAAHDARRDPRTAAFTHSYLEPLGIGAMLDAPIRAGGAFVGVLCLEHVGSPRSWQPDEEQFAGSVASHIALALEAHEREAALRKLRASEETYRAIFQAANDMIFVHDPRTGKVLDVNDKVQETLGYTPEEARGLTLDDLGAGEAPYTSREALAVFQAAMEEGPRLLEWRTRTKSGELRWVEVNVRYAFLGGEPRILAIVRDITARKEAAAALEAHRSRLEEIVEERTGILARREFQLSEAQRLAHVGSWYWDVSANKVHWSEEMFRIAGLDPAAGPLTYERFLQVVHPEDRGSVARTVQGALKARTGYDVHHRFLRPDGAVRWIHGRGRVVEEDTPEGLRIVGAAMDVTETHLAQEALRESEQRFRFLAEHARDIVFHLQLVPERRWLYVSPAVTRIVGYTPEEHYADPDLPRRLIDPEDLPKVEAAVSGESEGPFTVRCRRKDGAHVWLEQQGAPLRDASGGIVAYHGIIRDVTERKRAEEETRRLTEGLEAKMAELARLNDDLDAFTSMVSHDLRGPLRRLRTVTLLLEEDYRERLGEEGRDLLDRVRSETLKLSTLIDDLLAFSRAGRAATAEEPVDLTALAREAVASLQARDPKHALEVHIEQGMQAPGDPALLKVVLDNLLGNAWKYSSRVERPRIEVGSRKEAGGRRVFYVRDNGVGFDPAEADRLFQPFERLSSSRGFEGSGVGLATVKRVLERHGGKVWAEGAPGKGATFSFSL